jgi:coenzyme PQQ precursor peptide PqqA
MKIMRCISWLAGLGAGQLVGTMRCGVQIPAATVWRCVTSKKEIDMQWTTPTATDLRLGFEITMYVAAR